MNRLTAVGAAIVLAVVCASSASAICNSEDGNVPSWTNVNYVGVQDGEIWVCQTADNLDPAATAYAVDAWNDAVGKELLHRGCPAWTAIYIVDRPDGDCGWTQGMPNPACAEMPTWEGPEVLKIKVVDALSGYSLPSQEHAIGHELGHTLGFFHWPTCDSVMTGCYDIPGPTAVDADNYEKAYWVEAVTDLSAWAPLAYAVSLAWNPVNSVGERLCNEKEFSVWRRDPSSGRYDIHVATAGQDSTGIAFVGEPNGGQCYAVWSMTDARSFSFAGYDVIGASVPPGGPCGNADSDGDVGAVDALFVLQYVVGLRAGDDACVPGSGVICLPHSDANLDGEVSAVDALFMLQYVIGLRDLCVCPAP
jgi:hypothetical protein